jgi:hypothetical protein
MDLRLLFCIVLSVNERIGDNAASQNSPGALGHPPTTISGVWQFAAFSFR